jgi:hypothetical protein
MNKKLKQGIIIVIGIFAIVFGLSRLDIQSVSDYERESEELSRELGLGEPEQTEPELSAVSPASVKTSATETKKPKTKKAEKKKAEKKEVKTRKPAETKSPKETRSEKKADKKQEKTTITPEPSEKTATESKATAKVPAKNTITCTIEIRVDSLNDRRDTLEPDILTYVPENGILLEKTKVTVKKNTTAYQILAQVCKAKKIALDAEYTPLYGSYYVKGIGHLYEMDAGDMSGWLYMVNGTVPDVGASAYELSDGDTVLWGYTCDGRSV